MSHWPLQVHAFLSFPSEIHDRFVFWILLAVHMCSGRTRQTSWSPLAGSQQCVYLFTAKFHLRLLWWLIHAVPKKCLSSDTPTSDTFCVNPKRHLQISSGLLICPVHSTPPHPQLKSHVFIWKGHLWRLEDNLWGSILSYAGLRGQTWAFSLAASLYSTSHLAGLHGEHFFTPFEEFQSWVNPRIWFPLFVLLIRIFKKMYLFYVQVLCLHVLYARKGHQTPL